MWNHNFNIVANNFKVLPYEKKPPGGQKLNFMSSSSF